MSGGNGFLEFYLAGGNLDQVEGDDDVHGGCFGVFVIDADDVFLDLAGLFLALVVYVCLLAGDHVLAFAQFHGFHAGTHIVYLDDLARQDFMRSQDSTELGRAGFGDDLRSSELPFEHKGFDLVPGDDLGVFADQLILQHFAGDGIRDEVLQTAIFGSGTAFILKGEDGDAFDGGFPGFFVTQVRVLIVGDIFQGFSEFFRGFPLSVRIVAATREFNAFVVVIFRGLELALSQRLLIILDLKYVGFAGFAVTQGVQSLSHMSSSLAASIWFILASRTATTLE